MDVTTVGDAFANFTLSLFLLWLIAMLVFGGLPAAWLAATRGREPFLWMVIGLVLGPLAVLLIGLAPLGTRGNYRRCPRCAEAIRSEASRCPHCAWDAMPLRS